MEVSGQLHLPAALPPGKQPLLPHINEVIIISKINSLLAVKLAARSEARTDFDRSNTGIVSSNPARGMDMCPRLSVLCSLVYVVVLQRADPPSRESYQMSKK
jgi:hypothetical protein